MTSDEPPGQPGWPQDEAAARSVLDQCFDASTLSALRAAAQACVAQAGIPAERATDIVIALHELAANAVRHGAGSGRLRIWDPIGALYCRVDDDGQAATRSKGHGGAQDGAFPARTSPTAGPASPGTVCGWPGRWPIR